MRVVTEQNDRADGEGQKGGDVPVLAVHLSVHSGEDRQHKQKRAQNLAAECMYSLYFIVNSCGKRYTCDSIYEGKAVIGTEHSKRWGGEATNDRVIEVPILYKVAGKIDNSGAAGVGTACPPLQRQQSLAFSAHSVTHPM